MPDPRNVVKRKISSQSVAHELSGLSSRRVVRSCSPQGAGNMIWTAWLQNRRMDRFLSVLSRWERKQLSAMEAGEILGCSKRQFRRYRAGEETASWRVCLELSDLFRVGFVRPNCGMFSGLASFGQNRGLVADPNGGSATEGGFGGPRVDRKGRRSGAWANAATANLARSRLAGCPWPPLGCWGGCCPSPILAAAVLECSHGDCRVRSIYP
jgi:hypothetical protein